MHPSTYPFQGRLATWSRLVVITTALQLGYAWVAALDSDTVQQPLALT